MVRDGSVLAAVRDGAVLFGVDTEAAEAGEGDG